MIQKNMLQGRGRPIIVGEVPSFARPDSQLVSASQIYEPEYGRWAPQFGGHALDRKSWEYCYIAQAIHTYVDLSSPKRGLCFGSGKEKLPSILAAQGHSIVCSDVPDQEGKDWQTHDIEDLFYPDVIDRETFERNASFRPVDMNVIPDDLRDFDFLWSTGTLEHIGGHANGMRFVENAMECLRPGGIAVHTTEYTITSKTVSRDHPDLSFYCEADIRQLAERLTSQGHLIVLNFTRGDTVADTHVDTPPYHWGMTLTAHFHSHIITSIGLIIQHGV